MPALAHAVPLLVDVLLILLGLVDGVILGWARRRSTPRPFWLGQMVTGVVVVVVFAAAALGSLLVR